MGSRDGDSLTFEVSSQRILIRINRHCRVKSQLRAVKTNIPPPNTRLVYPNVFKILLKKGLCFVYRRSLFERLAYSKLTIQRNGSLWSGKNHSDILKYFFDTCCSPDQLVRSADDSSGPAIHDFQCTKVYRNSPPSALAAVISSWSFFCEPGLPRHSSGVRRGLCTSCMARETSTPIPRPDGIV